MAVTPGWVWGVQKGRAQLPSLLFSLLRWRVEEETARGSLDLYTRHSKVTLVLSLFASFSVQVVRKIT